MNAHSLFPHIILPSFSLTDATFAKECQSLFSFTPDKDQVVNEKLLRDTIHKHDVSSLYKYTACGLFMNSLFSTLIHVHLLCKLADKPYLYNKTFYNYLCHTLIPTILPDLSDEPQLPYAYITKTTYNHNISLAHIEYLLSTLLALSSILDEEPPFINELYEYHKNICGSYHNGQKEIRDQFVQFAPPQLLIA